MAHSVVSLQSQKIEKARRLTDWFRGGKLLTHYIFFTLHDVHKQLERWTREARLCGDEELRKQALLSIQMKTFHCQGGGFFSVPFSLHEKELLRLIVAYQTLCDYLDNLCDRARVTDENAFRQLHQSLLDALQADKAEEDYYRYYPWKEDSGYIHKLITECRLAINQLPSFSLVREDALRLVRLYIDLQVYKHLSLEIREQKLRRWAESFLDDYPEMEWQEFSAACGSTLALFALLGLASQPDLDSEAIQPVVQDYFPWICGLHILLDYFIDQQEDREGEDLNFTFYYENEQHLISRLKFFIHQSYAHLSNKREGIFDRTVIDGLLAMYLSDGKVQEQGYRGVARELIKASGGKAMTTFHLCAAVRKFI